MADAETKKTLAQILKLLEGGQAQADAVNERLDKLESKVDAVLAEQKKISDQLNVATLTGRVEEQSRTIASLIPHTIAAVGR